MRKQLVFGVDQGSVYMTTCHAPGLPDDTTTAALLQIPIDGAGATTLATTSGQRPADGASVRKKCK